MLNKLYTIANECTGEMKENKRIIMTATDGQRHYSDNICHICNEHSFKDSEPTYKLKDHDHRTGKYRGPAQFKGSIN